MGRAAYRRRWNQQGGVLLLSFPKAGRTWLRMMLGRALTIHAGLADQAFVDILDLPKLSPEIPRILPSHDDSPHLKTPGELVTKKTEYSDCKVILLVRDIRDMIASLYFHQLKRSHRFNETLHDFLRCPRDSLDSAIAFYNIWAENEGIPAAMLWVRYEDMHADCALELKRVLDFVGIEDIRDATVRDAVEYSRFENMRRMEVSGCVENDYLRSPSTGDANSLKTRRGAVGAYAEYFDREDIDYVDRKLWEELSPRFQSYRLPTREPSPIANYTGDGI